MLKKNEEEMNETEDSRCPVVVMHEVVQCVVLVQNGEIL